ncbi:MAG: hypothetical protein QM634_07770 [Gordonia sp. (in: high G+C Gram-positive bacteria)]
MTKRRKNSVLTRTVVAAAVALGVGVGGATVAGVFGHDAKPELASRTAVLDFGSLNQSPFGPQPADKPVPPAKHKPHAVKPGAKHPGQKKQRSYRVRNNNLPGVGRVCGAPQASRIRTTAKGTVVCAHMGSGKYRWIRINGVDPQVRKPGVKCTGQYTTARSPRGKAMQCARGRWTYNG